MTIYHYRCEGCGIRFGTDLELSEEFLELRFCPTCGSVGHLVAEGEPIGLCPSCREALPPDPDADDEPATYTLC